MSQQQHDLESMSAAEKRELLAQLLDRSPEDVPSTLSLEQRRLWMLLQLDETKPWQLFTALRVTGPLDLAAMQLALTELVQRHEVLRMVFVNVNGQPVGSVASAVTLRLPVVELADDLDAELARLAVREAQSPFDIEKGPLVRATVVRRGPDDHVLAITMHQLVADRRSMRLFVAELLTTYAALVDGGDAKLPPARAHFSEFVTAQREWLGSAEAAEDTEYWRDRLTGLVPLELPTDRPRPLMKTINGDSVGVDLDADLVSAVLAYAERGGHDLSTVLMAGFAAVLGRYSLRTDLAIGIAGLADTDTLVGPLENMLPVRVDLSGDPSLDDLANGVGQSMTAALAHGRLPFERIVTAASPQRDLSHTPLFQTFFTVDDEPPTRDLAGATATTEEVDNGWTPHDIDLFAVRRGPDMRLRADFNRDLFDRDTVRGLVERIVLLLRAAVAEPTRPLGRIALLDDADLATVLTSWNATEQDSPKDRCLHELVEQAAREHADDIAVIVGDDRLTYRELDDRANALAGRLVELGAQPESRIGVLVDRSVDAMVGLLGVLKSGAAYVPLDPAYPTDRLKYIVDDAGIALLVGTARQLADLPMLPVTTIDISTVDINGKPAVQVRPDNLAYLIYTSGSTGRPKGVAVEHRQIVHSTSARSACETTGLPERYLVLAPLTFDASAGGVYWTLTRGGTLVFPTDSEVYDPRQLGSLIRRLEITHFDGVPAQYSVLLDTDLGSHESVRTCVLAGEALPPALVRDHFERSPKAALFNEYGPTEATVWAAVHACQPEDADTVRVPIGKPIPNAKIYLLDEQFNPVPPGVAGELYIGGGGVTRGYVGRPGTTAERFLPDPYSGARLYRTGDRARYRPDGSIEFLGRVDNQVKIRGFRVELAEIENVLLRHPLVTEVVVRVLEDQPGVQRLVAYVVPVAGRVVTHDTLTAHAVGHLPDYMVPAHFVSLERLPLTRHGKIDIAALPAPEEIFSGGYVEPRDQLEADIAETFAAVLGQGKISATASFFDLGGNSLLVARLAARLSREHDVDLPIDEIFRVPTVEGIARTVTTHEQRKDKVDSAALYAQQSAELLADVKLDPSIRPDGLPHADYLNPRHILVTGATGYLGAFLVVELVKRTDATIHCLVRAESAEAGEERIEQVLRRYLAWDESYRARIRPVIGDIGKPMLDLSRDQFDELAGTIDSIYHSAAIVNFTYPYDAMKPANVHGTEELLRLACRTKVKAFHHVSSVDVFMGTGAKRPFTEQDLTDKPIRVPTGYPRTKWVAEKIVAIARDRGLPLTIQRPWMITGHTETGASHHTDYLYVYLKGFLELGLLPLYNDVVNAVPVDFTAKSVVYTSLRAENFGKNFNITNAEPATMTQCYEWLRSFGYRLNVVDEEEARTKALDVDQDHVLYPMTPILRVATMRHAALDPDLQKQVNPVDECRVLLDALDGSGIECPPVNEEWAHSCFRYLVATGFLPEPDSQPVAAVG
ncbi:non-ribosomal peptide synthetase [Actinocrispum wychmicini]|uniref:Amino acid adenylation domain-containing protein/thioester reductase-like protein n=1 Tax=Actinocrispum wychmicini TaxID=1213861 RepID=A0A4R2J9S1_9PSEU|nr:non-ribosomal peptide synthetase [Actinocrispum wychmicini]TCO56101.1 amino acid adenylation domain-containing protein/thioester reductase-like protein [Actinocrispum wychmicini]